MNIEEFVKTIAPYLGWVTALVGWVTGVVQWRKRRKAEVELVRIRRRGDAPYLTPSATTTTDLFVGATANSAETAGTDTVLSVFRAEVPKDVPAGTPIRFVIENEGEGVRGVSVTLDGQDIDLKQEPELSFAHGLTYLEYPYAPGRHGAEQRLVLAFETASGIQDRHTYIIKHGVRFLKRIDPV